MTYDSRRGRIMPPDLDDRTWADLVAQMRALIPQYAPQWTDNNTSDLGITLIELFAWLAEGMIYRLNQTPEKNYLTFLNLLGITRDPAGPARSHLTFMTTGTTAVTVAAGAQAQTATPQGSPVVFETDEDVTVVPTTLTAALEVGPFGAGAGSGTYADVSPTLIGPPAATWLLEVAPGQSVQLCLGFDRRVTDDVELGLRLYGGFTTADQPTVSWTASTAGTEPLSWPAATVVSDGTAGLRRDGQVRLRPPAGWAAQRAAGDPQAKPWTSVTPATPDDAVPDALFWLGLKIANPAGANPVALGVDRLLFNAASASTALTVRVPEELGTSTGGPFQVFELAHAPVYRRPGLDAPFADLAVQVGTGTPPQWQDWTLVDELPPGPGLCYRLDPVTGEIRFGNHDPATGEGHGSVPPRGARVQALSYRYVESGGGGNVDAGRVTVVGTTRDGARITGVSSVTNLGPGRDGSDEEPIEETLRRAPQELKIRDRAVTADDYEFLARESSNDVRIVRCLPPRLQTADGPTKGDPWTYAGIVRAPGAVTVVIVPDQGLAVARPEPTPDQIRQVRAYLEPRRDLTAHLDITGPRYLPVIVAVELVIWQQALDAGAVLDLVRSDTLDKIRTFLHPTRGGPDGAGWQVGLPVFTSDLFRAIMPSDDLGYVSSLQVKADLPAYHFPPLNPAGTATNFDPKERPVPQGTLGASVRVADYELVCAAADALHTIKPTVASL